MNAIWLIGVFGWSTTFIIWIFRIVALRRLGQKIPRWMWVVTLGWFIFSLMSIALFFNYEYFAPAVRLLFSLSSLGALLATIIKDGRIR